MRVKVLSFLLILRKTTSLTPVLLGKIYKCANPTHCNVILPRAFQIRNSYSEPYVYKPHLYVPVKTLTSSMALTPHRCMWNFWWTELFRLASFSQYLVFLQPVSIHKQPTVIFTYRLPYTVLAVHKIMQQDNFPLCLSLLAKSMSAEQKHLFHFLKSYNCIKLSLCRNTATIIRNPVISYY